MSLRKIADQLKTGQGSDLKIIKIIDGITKKPNNLYQIYEGVLFQMHPDVPDSLKRALVLYKHEKLGHPGGYKTLSYLKRNYYWHTTARDVKQIILYGPLPRSIWGVVSIYS